MTVFSMVLRCAARWRFCAVGASCLFLTIAASAQCPAWIPTFFYDAGLDIGHGTGGPVRALATFDDGGVEGVELYVGGQFGTVAWTPTGGLPGTSCIARWNSTTEWSAVGSNGLGMNNSVLALTTYGGQLYAGGLFTNADGTAANYIARWNGSSWSSVGTGMNGAVHALTTFGGQLYAGGLFTTAGGTSAKYIARWNGTAWSSVGSGMNDSVRALTTSSGKLYAGGFFTKADGKAAKHIASWNGTAWSKVGTGVSGAVFALTDFNNQLYAGGMLAGGIQRWNGSAWSGLGGGMNNTVASLATFDDGSGTALYAGGYFSTAGGTPANYIAKWDLSLLTWSALGTGLWLETLDPPPAQPPAVFALATFEASLHVGGFFQVADPDDLVLYDNGNLARWGCP